MQFFRYLLPLLARGARISFLGPAHLRRLLSSFPGEVELLDSVAGRRFDFRSTLWALPHLLWGEVGALPGPIPYLHAEPRLVERWATFLAPGAINVGICWQGNPARKIDSGRSIPLADFPPLSRVPGVRLFRQTRLDDWSGVFEEMAAALGAGH